MKAHVLDYYLRVARWILPHLRGRPLALRRYPRGIGAESFYSKDWTGEALPPFVRRLPVSSQSRGAPIEYACAEGRGALAWLAQTGAVEAHPWLSRVGSEPHRCATADGVGSAECGLDRPDLLLFDLDPYVRAGRTGTKGREAGGEPGLDSEDWRAAVEAALEVRDVLRELKLPFFAKTSGKRGVHVLVPLVPERPYREVRAVAGAIAADLARRRPDLMTLSYDPRERRGRVFLDVLQNARGKTVAAPFSLRPTPEATVSMPLGWDAREEADPRAFDVDSVPRLLKEGGDPWKGFDGARRSLSALLA